MWNTLAISFVAKHRISERDKKKEKASNESLIDADLEWANKKISAIF